MQELSAIKHSHHFLNRLSVEETKSEGEEGGEGGEESITRSKVREEGFWTVSQEKRNANQSRDRFL